MDNSTAWRRHQVLDSSALLRTTSCTGICRSGKARASSCHQTRTGTSVCVTQITAASAKRGCGLQPGNYLDSGPLDAEDLHVVILMDS